MLIQVEVRRVLLRFGFLILTFYLLEGNMANFSKKTKQRIIDDYLHATGANMYVPSEFVSWLSGRHDHECYSAFYGVSNDDLADKYRIDLARSVALWLGG